MATEKRVQITIEASASFVRMLRVHLTFSGAFNKPKRDLTPSQVLALAAFAEMQGAYEHQVDELIPVEWQADLKVLHEKRKVLKDCEFCGGFGDQHESDCQGMAHG